jgi:hypothetical protein
MSRSSAPASTTPLAAVATARGPTSKAVAAVKGELTARSTPSAAASKCVVGRDMNVPRKDPAADIIPSPAVKECADDPPAVGAAQPSPVIHGALVPGHEVNALDNTAYI